MLKLDYIETLKMVTDGLTKPLILIKYENYIFVLRLVEKSQG